MSSYSSNSKTKKGTRASQNDIISEISKITARATGGRKQSISKSQMKPHDLYRSLIHEKNKSECKVLKDIMQTTYQINLGVDLTTKKPKKSHFRLDDDMFKLENPVDSQINSNCGVCSKKLS